MSDARMQPCIRHGLCIPEPDKKNGKTSPQKGIYSNIVKYYPGHTSVGKQEKLLSLPFPLILSKYGRKHDRIKSLDTTISCEVKQIWG